jgi:hypothetical protein
MIMKKTFCLLLTLAILSNCYTVASAAEVNSMERGFSWSEEKRVMPRRTNLKAADDEWDWQLQSTKTFETDIATHVMSSYILYAQTSDYRWCKAETTHTSTSGKEAYGYSRARFETIFGKVVDGSDSGRCWRTGKSTAMTPLDNDGFSGIAHTYCGDRTT